MSRSIPLAALEIGLAVFLNEFQGVFGSDRHTTLKDAMQIEQIEADNLDDTEDDLANEMNAKSPDG